MRLTFGFALAGACAALVMVGAAACGGDDDGGSLNQNKGPSTSGGSQDDGSAVNGPGFEDGDKPPMQIDNPDQTPAYPKPDGGPALTWTDLYKGYFGPNSVGHCSGSGQAGACHSDVRDHFKCGASKDECYQGLVDAKLIDLSNPKYSRIVDQNRTPLAWFDCGKGLSCGNMPDDVNKVNQTAADEVAAWVYDGAKNN